MSTQGVGNKRICSSCGARFYDLGKNPAPCPKCKTMNDANAPVKIRRKSKAAAAIDVDDPLVKQKAKQDARNKVKKSSAVDDDMEDFEYIPSVDVDDEIEEIEDIDDIDSIDELEAIEGDEPMDDDLSLDEESMEGEVLIDELEEVEEEEEAEETASASKSGYGKKKDSKK